MTMTVSCWPPYMRMTKTAIIEKVFQWISTYSNVAECKNIKGSCQRPAKLGTSLYCCFAIYCSLLYCSQKHIILLISLTHLSWSLTKIFQPMPWSPLGPQGGCQGQLFVQAKGWDGQQCHWHVLINVRPEFRNLAAYFLVDKNWLTVFLDGHLAAATLPLYVNIPLCRYLFQEGFLLGPVHIMPKIGLINPIFLEQ